MNAKECLNNVEKLIKDLAWANSTYSNIDYVTMTWRGTRKVFKIGAIYRDLNIFDWWEEELSLSQLAAMRAFLKQAIKLGFTGYVCFKVGAAGCSHGMWAHKNESTNGYSPEGDVLFHSFRSGENYFDMQLNGVWMHEKYATKENPYPDFKLADIKAELNIK